MVKAGSYLERLTTKNMLVQFHNSEGVIVVHNSFNRPVRIRAEKAIATLDLKSIINFYCAMSHFSSNFESNTV